MGTKIEADFKGNGKYYPGVISRVRLGGSAYDIKYDDGEREMGVTREKIRVLEASGPGAGSSARNNNTEKPWHKRRPSF